MTSTLNANPIEFAYHPPAHATREDFLATQAELCRRGSELAESISRHLARGHVTDMARLAGMVGDYAVAAQVAERKAQAIPPTPTVTIADATEWAYCGHPRHEWRATCSGCNWTEKSYDPRLLAGQAARHESSPHPVSA